MKKKLYKLICLICVFTAMLSCISIPARADGIAGKEASVFAYALNDKMYQYGVISTGEPGSDVEMSGGNYPSGVIYSDVIYFDNNDSPYLVIFRADGAEQNVTFDIFKYNEKLERAEAIAVVSKGYNTDAGVEGQFAVGENGDTKYIIYREYTNSVETNAEYYTVIDGTAYKYIQSPPCAASSGVVSWNSQFFRPYVDVSSGNAALTVFFSQLKDASGAGVSYEDISERITAEETERLENVLSRAAKFTNFEIGSYSTITDYNLGLTRRDTDDKFYLITNLYDLGDEIYYARFSTDKSFYNYALLRRTDDSEEPYQLLVAKTDSIPLSDTELKRLKEVLNRNKLVAQAARGSIETESVPFLHIGSNDAKETEKPLKMPKLIDPSLRRPAALIGGGASILALIFLWIYLAMGEEEERYR
ncbi:MAG TPA: hypothetical protein IAA61_11340 [Candidatus Ornithomonoglobus merdipullorum]|uniref:Uncharacterized protein n=1 Tax=Candidatus Ornithomonoglobus merdipullorum TaxID=2840895 RepID=A0A9D1SG59_9FIRM|nr:hypothetical protein [Candidatus Ornithomonoglobus merdipullorum]